MRGYSAIGLWRPKNPQNIGGALRAAHCYDAGLIAIEDRSEQFLIGVEHPTNTPRAERHIPLIHGPLKEIAPHGCVPIAVDIVDSAISLHAFQHPRNAFYLFGPEDGTLSQELLDWAQMHVFVPTRNCMNLYAAVNVVLYDRQAKELRDARKAA